jgi:hypothetical protein
MFYLCYSSPCHNICTDYCNSALTHLAAFHFPSGGYSLCTIPSYSEAISRLESNPQPSGLSHSASTNFDTACPVLLFEGLHTHPAVPEMTTAPTLMLEFLLSEWKGQASLKLLCTSTRQHVVISNMTVKLRLKHIFHSRIKPPFFFPIFDTKVPTLCRIIYKLLTT